MGNDVPKAKFTFTDYHNWLWCSLIANNVDYEKYNLNADEAMQVLTVLLATERAVPYDNFMHYIPKKGKRREAGMIDEEGAVQLYDKKGKPAGRMNPLDFISQFSNVEYHPQPVVKK
jgi:hypothetical protein